MDKQQLLKQLEKAWAAIKESYAGLSDSQLTESGVMGNWSVKDILAHADVLRQLDETHRRLIDYIRGVPEEYFTQETRFRHRLRLDTYSHYPKHAKAIREWRERPVE